MDVEVWGVTGVREVVVLLSCVSGWTVTTVLGLCRARPNLAHIALGRAVVVVGVHAMIESLLMVCVGGVTCIGIYICC